MTFGILRMSASHLDISSFCYYQKDVNLNISTALESENTSVVNLMKIKIY